MAGKRVSEMTDFEIRAMAGAAGEEDGLFWISCQPLLLEAMKFMGLPGYRTCGEAPRRPGGMHTPDKVTSHYHGVPLAVASTWTQYHTEGRKPLGFK